MSVTDQGSTKDIISNLLSSSHDVRGSEEFIMQLQESDGATRDLSTHDRKRTLTEKGKEYLIRTNFRGHLISRIWNTNISRALIFAILQKMTNLGHLISRKLTIDRLRKPFFFID